MRTSLSSAGWRATVEEWGDGGIAAGVGDTVGQVARNLRDDLLAAASHFADSGDRAALVLSRILSEIGRDPELYRAAREGIGGPPVAVLVAVIERWIERGVVPSGIPVELIAGIVPTAAFGSVTLRQRALETQSIRELVDFVLLPALAR